MCKRVFLPAYEDDLASVDLSNLQVNNLPHSALQKLPHLKEVETTQGPIELEIGMRDDAYLNHAIAKYQQVSFSQELTLKPLLSQQKETKESDLF